MRALRFGGVPDLGNPYCSQLSKIILKKRPYQRVFMLKPSQARKKSSLHCTTRMDFIASETTEVVLERHDQMGKHRCFGVPGPT